MCRSSEKAETDFHSQWRSVSVSEVSKKEGELLKKEGELLLGYAPNPSRFSPKRIQSLRSGKVEIQFQGKQIQELRSMKFQELIK